MFSLYMLPSCIPLIRGANTEENTYIRKGHSKIHNRKGEEKGMGEEWRGREGEREGEREGGREGGREGEGKRVGSYKCHNMLPWLFTC